MPKSIAIVGASSDRKKYGNKAVRAFRDGGWTVYPIHPTAKEIEGLPAYASLEHLPGPVDRISLYVPPQVGLNLVPEIAKTPHKELFLNPGSESPELSSALEAAGLHPMLACSIVNIGLRPEMYPDS